MWNLPVVVLAATVLFSSNIALGDIQIEPGEWSYTMKTKIEGLGIPLPAIPVTFKTCVKDRDPVFQTPEMTKAGCNIENRNENGDFLSYTVRCTSSDGSSDTQFEIRYGNASLDGSFDQVIMVDGKVQSTSTGTIKGERLGGC